MNIRVAISGKMGSGKTTLAKALQAEFSNVTDWYDASGYRPEIRGFGTPIRELLSLGNINKSDPDFRLAAQTLGMTMRHTDPNFWINVFYNQAPASVIVDDLRFKNEFEFCKRHGFYLIRLIGSFTNYYVVGAPEITHVSETDLDNVDEWDFAHLVTPHDDTQELTKILSKNIREHFSDRNVQ